MYCSATFNILSNQRERLTILKAAGMQCFHNRQLCTICCNIQHPKYQRARQEDNVFPFWSGLNWTGLELYSISMECLNLLEILLYPSLKSPPCRIKGRGRPFWMRQECSVFTIGNSCSLVPSLKSSTINISCQYQSTTIEPGCKFSSSMFAMPNINFTSCPIKVPPEERQVESFWADWNSIFELQQSTSPSMNEWMNE